MREEVDMRLQRSGPEMNSAGELMEFTVEISADVEQMKEIGRQLAGKEEYPDAAWVETPLGSGRWFMAAGDMCFLRIVP